MKLESTFILRGKVAKRIFLQFILCALLPIFGLAIVSYPLVKAELEKLGEGRLHEFSRYLSLSVYDRLKSLEDNLNGLSSGLKENAGAAGRIINDANMEFLRNRYKALAITSDSGKSIPLLGDLKNAPVPTQREWQHLGTGKSLMIVLSDKDNLGRVFMMNLIDSQSPNPELLVGEINTMYLWGLGQEKTLPAMTDLFVLDKTAKVLFSTHPAPPPFYKNAAFHQSRSSTSRFEWEYEGEKYYTGSRSIFTQYHWFYPRLTIVLSAPSSDIYALIGYFNKIFASIILLSIFIIAFLSATQIRRITEPLVKLKAAAKKVALGDFNAKVTVMSGDEFQEMGEKFNDMAKQLGWQFDALKTLAEIDRAVLSALDMDKIIDTVVSRVKAFYDCDMVTISLFESNDDGPVLTYGRLSNNKPSKTGEIAKFSREALKQFIDNRGIVSISGNDNVPRYLLEFTGGRFQRLIILPLIIQGDLAGVISIIWDHSVVLDEKRLGQARQIADQVTVAVSNAKLLQALQNLTWASLYALANAVDKKSPWTQDHAKRVMDISRAIGETMGLSSDAMTDLERAALIHDIGKIGIADNILTKDGKLSEDERREIESHPRKGAEILRPLVHVSAFAHIIPMVLQHHEHFDGTGYPDGLAGNRIDLGARILAVSDVYDALMSDRPYRKGMIQEQVLEILRKDSGRHFDPLVVNALMKALQQEKSLKDGRGENHAILDSDELRKLKKTFTFPDVSPRSHG